MRRAGYVTAARLIAGLGLIASLTAPALAEVPAEKTGQVEQLPLPPHAHWAWVGDLILQRSALVDLDDGRFLGMINGGYGTMASGPTRSRSTTSPRWRRSARW